LIVNRIKSFSTDIIKTFAMKKTMLTITLSAFLLSGTILLAQSQKITYKITRTFSLPGDGGWDYLTVDASAGRLFVSHGTMVQVVDLKSGQLAGTIPNTFGVHGVALAPDLNKGFISDGRDSSVTIVNLKTLATLATIRVTGNNPDAILYDPFTKRVFVFNGRSADATVIDAKNDSVMATIPLDGKPEFAVTDGNGSIYVNIEDKSQIARINAKTLNVEEWWPLAPGEEPTGLALDNTSHRLFSACANTVLVVADAFDGHVVTTLPIGEGCDGVKYDPMTKRIFCSNGAGTLTVIQQKNGDSYSVIGNFPTQEGARTLAVDTLTHRVYLSVADVMPPSEPSEANVHVRRLIKPGTFKVVEMGD
jgi:YVTN family beta-propeller protein